MIIDFLQILNDYKISYKSISGTDEKVLTCPACGKEDHFYFNVKKSLGICHRCKWNCNAVAFLMAVLNLDRDAAVELCKGQRDRSLDGLRGRVRVLLDEQEISFDALETYDVFFKNPLPNGVEDITRKKFPKVFRERGVAYEDVISLSPKICNSSGRYFGRIIFPIKTLKSETFTAITSFTREKFRKIRESYAERGIKYRKSLFPPKSFMSEMIYMYEDYKDSEDSLFIVEGIWDALKMKRLGYNVNCVLGSSVSKRQAYLFSRTNAKKIYLMLDGDVPKSHIKMMHKLLSETCFDKDVMACFLPKNKDPDEASLSEIEFTIKNSRKYLF